MVDLISQNSYEVINHARQTANHQILKWTKLWPLAAKELALLQAAALSSTVARIQDELHQADQEVG